MSEENKRLTRERMCRWIKGHSISSWAPFARFNTSQNRSFLIATILFVPAIGYLRVTQRITDGETLSVLVLFFVLLVTTWYARSTHEIARETREQRLAGIQPLILQKAVQTEISASDQSDFPQRYFSEFIAWNAGNGPAIELEISLLNKVKHAIAGKRETFLRADEQIVFTPQLADRPEEQHYLVCEYKHAALPTGNEVWDQTWLPFRIAKASELRQVYVIAGELTSKFRVISKDRIDTFTKSGKPT